MTSCFTSPALPIPADTHDHNMWRRTKPVKCHIMYEYMHSCFVIQSF
jgi:hypothetical protein